MLGAFVTWPDQKKKGLALKHQNTKSPPRTGHTWQWVYKVSRSFDISRRQYLQNLGLWLRRKSKKIPELRVLRNQVTNGPSGCSLSPPSLRSTQLLPCNFKKKSKHFLEFSSDRGWFFWGVFFCCCWFFFILFS